MRHVLDEALVVVVVSSARALTRGTRSKGEVAESTCTWRALACMLGAETCREGKKGGLV